jgi:hypothetical protein
VEEIARGIEQQMQQAHHTRVIVDHALPGRALGLREAVQGHS